MSSKQVIVERVAIAADLRVFFPISEHDTSYAITLENDYVSSC